MGSELYVYFETDVEVRAEQLDELAADTGAGSRRREAGQIVARLDAASEVKRGEEAELWVDATNLHLFDPDSGERARAAARTRRLTRLGYRAAVELLAEAVDHVLVPLVGAQQQVAVRTTRR